MPPQDLHEQLKAFEGQSVGTPVLAPDPVNEPMIRHWCQAVDDRNPVYTDPDFAKHSVHVGIVAPPTMLQAWTMRGLRPPARDPQAAQGPQARLFELLDAAGFTSVVATNCTQEYSRYLRPGDQIDVVTEIESVSPEKETGLGTGHFITQRMIYRNQDGEEVGVMRFRLLKFQPRKKKPAAEPTQRRPTPRPGITRDSAFFWEGVAAGKLLIQRCSGCAELRHPPGPMCPACSSLEWDSLEACGRGSVYSFVVMHHPPVPPFEYPNPIALVQLEEGTRIVARLVGVAPADVKIGMPVRCEITEVDEGFRVPLFRPDQEQDR